MPCWYFEKREMNNTMSIREGMSIEEERLYRKQGAQFVIDLGYKMGLPPETLSTGVLFFHRFYVYQSFQKYPKYVMATCCLFLAGKVEETPKKLRVIWKAAVLLLDETNRSEEKKLFGEDQRGDVIAYYERVLLTTVKFDFLVESPYSYLKKYAKTIKGSRENIKKMLQMAWTFINDSFGTTLCLQWEPEIIAIAVMYLASKLSKFEITDWEGKQENSTKKWWEQFVEHLSIDILEDICHQVLDLLTSPPGKDEEPAVEIESNSNHKCQQQFENETPLSYSSGTNLIPQGNFNSFHQSITTAQQITTPAASCHPALNVNQSFSNESLVSTMLLPSQSIAPQTPSPLFDSNHSNSFSNATMMTTTPILVPMAHQSLCSVTPAPIHGQPPLPPQQSYINPTGFIAQANQQFVQSSPHSPTMFPRNMQQQSQLLLMSQIGNNQQDNCNRFNSTAPSGNTTSDSMHYIDRQHAPHQLITSPIYPLPYASNIMQQRPHNESYDGITFSSRLTGKHSGCSSSRSSPSQHIHRNTHSHQHHYHR